MAAVFVFPYLVLMLAWAGSNPPGAAPDEPDHLTKALGVGRFDVGTRYTGPPLAPGALMRRNASITRVVSIPRRLSPDGYACEAFQPNRTAACLPSGPVSGSGTVLARTSVGSYPPVLYFPIGLAARATSTPRHAFYAGRVVCVVMSSVLLFFGAAHLVRWLGRRTLLGAFVALTPMAVFASSMVTTSGAEIGGSFAVACAAVVAMRRPESLSRPGTQVLFAGAGTALILSRQLGIVTFVAVLGLLAVRVGWRPWWGLVRAHRPTFCLSAAVLLGAAVGIYEWERHFDHPSDTGPLFSRAALGTFTQQGFGILKQGIGQFGWLDTDMFRWAIAAWIILAVLVVGMAIVLGSAADRWSLAGWLVATWCVAYFAYATVFFPVNAGLQGRHMLPFFLLCPLLAGVVVVERLQALAPAALRRVFALVAAVMVALQLTALYLNARRYAVGADGPMQFLGHSQWHPPFGWAPWLVLTLVGAASLGVTVLACRPVLTPTEGTKRGLER